MSVASIFSAEDRHEQRQAADALALATIGFEQMIEDVVLGIDQIEPRNGPRPRPRPRQLDRCGHCPHGYLGGDDCPDRHCTCAA